MKELLKIISIRLYIYSIIISSIYAIASYGETFALAYFGTTPLIIDKIINLTICIIIIHIIMTISGKLEGYISNVNQVRIQTAIQKYYFNKLKNTTIGQIQNTHTGYIYKLISNVSLYFFEIILNFQISVIPLIIGGISILLMICKQSFITGIICIVISTLAVFIKYKMIKKRQKYQQKVNDSESRYSATLIDFIQNIIAVKRLNIQKFCENKIETYSEKYLDDTKTNERKRAMTNFIFTLLMDSLYIIVFFSTIIMVIDGKDGLPYLLFYMSALKKLYFNLNNLVKFIDVVEKFKTTKTQLDKYFKNIKDIKFIKDCENIELINVEFYYENSLTSIKIPNFILNKGDKISIMGESGQGKTTSINILSGLYPLKTGILRVNGNVEKDIKIDLVYISQEIEFFDLSIKDNLCLGKDIKENKIFELLEDAGLMEWYKKLPLGLETVIGEKGIKLSFGQKQRLNIIRGILMDKDIYFLDEPTSNLDNISEEKIIKMIKKYLNTKTYIIVTHRPKIKQLCNKHYIFKDHVMKELINV